MINRIIALVLTVLVLSSCSFFTKVKSERLGTDKPVIPNYGKRFEVYYGAQTVGWCDYIHRAVEYSDYDVDIEERFEEEITFRGMRYKFKFVLYGKMAELHVLRYDSQGLKFRPNDSYAIIKNTGGVYYRFFGEDGVTAIRDYEIRDPDKVANTAELFRYCDSYLGTYFGIFNDRKSREMRNNRVQSLGYELLQFERL
ncbi:hypothetical protein EP331_16015 [bacterium]|nr:MAG: hypothetical protein EP331_16015 [bacterium]